MKIWQMRAPRLPADQIGRYKCTRTGMRMYPVPDPRGVEYGLTALPGATTLLGALAPREDKERLEKWRAREVKAGRDPNAAAERGTKVHALLERRILGLKLESDDEEVMSYASGMDEGFNEFTEFLWSERPLVRGWEKAWNTMDTSHPDRLARVWSAEWGVSGVPDLIGVRRGRNVLSDFKSARVPYFVPEHGQQIPWGEKFNAMKFYKTCRQLSLYALAIEETLGLHIDELEIRVGYPGGSQIIAVPEMTYARELENVKKMCLEFWGNFYAMHGETSGSSEMLVAA